MGDRHMDFKVMEYEKFIDIFSDSILQLTLKKFPLKECWCSNQKKNLQLSEEATQITLSSPTTYSCKPWTPWTTGSAVHGNSPDKNTGVGCHALLQGIFPTQDQTQVSHSAGRFFTIWAPWEAQEYWSG